MVLSLFWWRELGNDYQIPIRSPWCHARKSHRNQRMCWCRRLADWWIELRGKSRLEERGREKQTYRICCVCVFVRTVSPFSYVCNWTLTIRWCIAYITYIGVCVNCFILHVYIYILYVQLYTCAFKTYWERWTNCLVLNYAGVQCRLEVWLFPVGVVSRSSSGSCGCTICYTIELHWL